MVVQDREDVLPRIRPPDVTAQGELREKNQITIPKPVIEATGLHPGEKVLFIVDPNDPNVVHMHRLRESYAGVLTGVYGIPEEAHAELRGEQEAWDE